MCHALAEIGAEWQRKYDELPPEEKWFLIEKKDGTKVGFIQRWPVKNSQELGYAIVPGERGKGYCTEAVQLGVDYLFMSKDIAGIHAVAHIENVASQRVLEKAGFQREGTIRKGMFACGKWAHIYLYIILREEWKEPKILKVLIKGAHAQVNSL